MNKFIKEPFDLGKIAESYDDWYQYPLGKIYNALEKRGIREILPDRIPNPDFWTWDAGQVNGVNFFLKWAIIYRNRGAIKSSRYLGMSYIRGYLRK